MLCLLVLTSFVAGTGAVSFTGSKPHFLEKSSPIAKDVTSVMRVPHSHSTNNAMIQSTASGWMTEYIYSAEDCQSTTIKQISRVTNECFAFVNINGSTTNSQEDSYGSEIYYCTSGKILCFVQSSMK